MHSIEQIKKNSLELHRLDEARKSAGAANNPLFSNGYIYSLIYPGGLEMFRRVKEQDPYAIEVAIRFLIADPRHDSSGYLKQDLWRHLAHCNLSISNQNQLERAALNYLKRRITREFWNMCKTMSRLGRTGFWIKVSDVAQAGNSPEATRAYFLLVHGANIHAGAKLRRAVYMSYIRKKFGGC